MPRPQERRMRGTERVRQKFPLRVQVLLIVTRMGRDYRPGPRQRIEQVARQGSLGSFQLSFGLSHCQCRGIRQKLVDFRFAHDLEKNSATVPVQDLHEMAKARLI